MKFLHLLLFLALPCGAQTIPDAPIPDLRLARYTVIGMNAVGDGFDYSSTRECIRIPHCREVELPKSFASGAGFPALIVGKLTLEVWLSNRVAHRHPRLALFGDILSCAGTNATVLRTYNQIAKAKRITQEDK
jgi:hypothetical protein